MQFSKVHNLIYTTVNGNAATIVGVLDSYPGLIGEVVELEIPIAQFLDWYWVMFDTTATGFSVAGEYDDGREWSGYGEVDLIGKSSLNPKEWIVPDDEIVLPETIDLSGGVDIDDVVALVSFIFAGDPISGPLMSADCDCSHSIDIDDVVYMIDYVFGGGNPPRDNDADGQLDC